MMPWLRRFDGLITLFEQGVITLGMALATLLLFTNVVMRYLFDSGLTWALEAVQYLFAWVVLVGAAYGIKAGIHLGIDLLVERFPPKLRKGVTLFAWLLTLLFATTIFHLSIQYITRIYRWGDLTLDLQIPQWIPYLAIPVGMGLMCYHLLEVGWQIWSGEREGIHASEGRQVLKEVGE